MEKVYLAKQKIFNRSGKVFAYELLFRDTKEGIKNFPTNIKATSHVLINILTNASRTLDETGIALVNVDEDFLCSGMVDLLDKDKFVLEILETTDLNEKVISQIKRYHKRGFKIAIDDFDCSLEMITKFTPLFKYIHLIKIDVIEAEAENLKNVVARLKKGNANLLAEKIETRDEYLYYLNMGFDLFQGYYLHRPAIVEIDRNKDVTMNIIINLIKIIKNDGHTQAIEDYIKLRPELSFKLIKFLNNQENFETELVSIVQVVTLLGRDRLLRWLLLYLYADMADNPVSEIILAIASKRASDMEASAKTPEDRDKAYIAGMFSMIGALFDMNNRDILKDIKLDKDITDLVINKKGKFLSSLLKSEQKEKVYLKKLLFDNFDKINPIDVMYTLGLNDIEIDYDNI